MAGISVFITIREIRIVKFLPKKTFHRISAVKVSFNTGKLCY